MGKGIKLLIVMLAILLAFGFWYKKTFSMKVATAYELNTTDELNRIYIATQGSVFKDLMVKQIGEHFAKENTYVKVADVADLPNISIADWNAVIVVHTWEMQKAPSSVKTFINDNSGSKKLVVFTTSGSGKDGMENVDGITGASVLSQINDHINEVKERVDPLLNK